VECGWGGRLSKGGNSRCDSGSWLHCSGQGKGEAVVLMMVGEVDMSCAAYHGYSLTMGGGQPCLVGL